MSVGTASRERLVEAWIRGSRAADAALVVAVLIAGSVSRHAVYTRYGVTLLVVSAVALAVGVWRGAGRTPPSKAAVVVALGSALFAQVIKPPYMNVDGRTWALRAGVVACMVVTVLAAGLLVARGRRLVMLGWAATIGIAASYALAIGGSGRPLIDVWPILQGASLGVVHGRNPYEMTFAGVPPGQVDDCFNYLPGTFLMPLPGRLLLGDVRYAEAAVLLAGMAALLWWAIRSARGQAEPAARIGAGDLAAGGSPGGRATGTALGGRPTGTAPGDRTIGTAPGDRATGSAPGDRTTAVGPGAAVAPALAVLAGVLPGSLYDVQQAWNETILFGALAAAGVLIAARRPWWAAAALAVALCTKQHVVLLLPLWALWPAFGPRRAVAAAAGAAAVTLPWFLADPARFRHCVVDFFLDLPARPDSLSIWHLVPGPLRAVAVLALVAVAYLLVLRAVPRTPGGLLLGCGLVLTAFALANKQSFLNQWLLASQLVVAGLVLVAARTRPVREIPLC